MRLWTNLVRIDSRSLLKFLIASNVILIIYQVFTIRYTIHVRPDRACEPPSAKPLVIIDELINANSNNNNINSNADGNDANPASGLVNSLMNTVMDRKLDATEGFKMPAISTTLEVIVAGGAASGQANAESKQPRIPWWRVETRTGYTVIYDYVLPVTVAPNETDSVTLTTQGTYEFLHHVENLCKRWDGSISVAVYAPGNELTIAVRGIHLLRKCGDPCLSKRVFWHLIYDVKSGLPSGNISFPEDLYNPEDLKCDQPYTKYIAAQPKPNFREKHRLPYPINVARNVARLAIRSKYLLASDIELYPSLHIVAMFKQLLEREKRGEILPARKSSRHVYTLPIFEVKAGLQPPETKRQLSAMVKKGDAIFFHKYVCDICQAFPDRDKWVNLLPENDTLNVFRATKRTRQRSTWEPLFIGTNDEPLYEEQLSWDGKRDKMSQMYEMCLMGYDLFILDNAFLVHAPGIKRIDAKDQQKRLPFMKRNEKFYKFTLLRLDKKFKKEKIKYGC